MVTLWENEKFKEKLIKTHTKKTGRYAKSYFEMDPFAQIIEDDRMQTLLTDQINHVFPVWNPFHK